jgi:hypothetical protein
MAGIFGGARSNAQTPTVYTGTQIQTSSAGVCIPIVDGANRVAPNVIWANGFEKHAGKGGGKGGKGGGGGGKGSSGSTTSYTYTTAVELALCEGQIQGVGQVWQNTSTLSSLGALNLTLFDGALGQAPPAWVTSNYPTEADGYSQTAYVFSSSYDLGSSASLPSHNFEVFGPNMGEVPGWQDINPETFLENFLFSTQYGCDPGASYLNTASASAYATYCLAQDLLISPYLHTQEQATSVVQRLAQITNSWIFWGGTEIICVPLGDSEQINNGATFIPNLTPTYDLGLSDFIFDPTSDDPVTVDIIDPHDSYNRVQLDIRDRDNGYNTNSIVWEDDASISDFGLLQSQIITCDEVCKSAVATIMAMLIGKRAVNIKNNYTFKLGPTFILLLPGDIVTLTEPNLGLSAFAVRITEIDEDENGTLTIKAEELLANVGSAIANPSQANAASAQPDLLISAGDINPPLIIEPSPEWTNGQALVWLGASGGANWGGADVYISSNGTQYAWIGQITGPSPQGTLTATLPAHSDPDTVDTLSVDMAMSGIALSTEVTSAEADAFQTAAVIGDEILSYGTVAATGALTSNLTYLRRGGYGTPIEAHSSGAQFTRINPAVMMQYPLPQQYVGVPLFFKFLSFNIFGNAPEDISSATAYLYTPVGAAFTIAPPTNVMAWTSVAGAGLVVTLGWTPSIGPSLAGYFIQWSTDGGATLSSAATVSAVVTSFQLPAAPPGTVYTFRIAAYSQNGMATSAYIVVSADTTQNAAAIGRMVIGRQRLLQQTRSTVITGR